jgi:hypothetical protein
LTVGAYGMVTLLVPTLSEVLLLGSRRSLAQGLGVMSAIGGPIMTLAPMFNPSYTPVREILPYDLAWMLLASLLAWVSMRWTIRSFDLWMGRGVSGGAAGLLEHRLEGSPASRPPILHG